MSKILNIAKALSTEKPLNEEWYDVRVAACNSCEHNSLNGAELSTLGKTLNKIGCPGKGSCTICNCCTDEKAKIKVEHCALKDRGEIPRWDVIEVVSNDFKVDLLSAGKIEFKNQTFYIDAGDVKKDLIKFKFNTHSKQFVVYEKLIAGCSCTVGRPKEIKKGKQYEIEVDISVKAFGNQSKSLVITYVSSTQKRYELPIKFTFNKIK